MGSNIVSCAHSARSLKLGLPLSGMIGHADVPDTLRDPEPWSVQELQDSSSSSMARKACMRRLEQLELMPSCGLAQHADEDALSEGSSQMEPQAAPLPTTESENTSKQAESNHEAPSWSASQQGSATENSSSFSGTQNHKQEASSSLRSLQISDTAAMAALTVQAFTGQMHFRPTADTGYWHSQVCSLPAAAQQFVLACLAERPVSMEKLMRDSFFTAEVRAAAGFLTSLEAIVYTQQQAAGSEQQPPTLKRQPQSVPRQACALQAMLAGPLDLKALAKRGALQLCIQSIMRVVADAATANSPSSVATSAVRQAAHPQQSTSALVAEVLLQLVMLSARSLAIQGPLQVWAALLGGRAPCGLPASPGNAAVQIEVQNQLMQADRLKQLVSGVGLSAYVDTVHSALLSAVCGGASDAEEPAAAQLTQHAIQVCTDLLKQDLSLAAWQAWRVAHHSINRHQYRTVCGGSLW